MADAPTRTVAYHDPCYLGRHNGVYDAPRNLLNILSNYVVELPRNRENSFCCGAGGAQFWKEEEPGTSASPTTAIAKRSRRSAGAEDKVLAVGCPFCKSMLESTPGKGADPIAVRDVAELLLEGVQRRSGKPPAPSQIATPEPLPLAEPTARLAEPALVAPEQLPTSIPPPASSAPEAPEARKKWAPKSVPASALAPAPVLQPPQDPVLDPPPQAPSAEDLAPKRKAWAPKKQASPQALPPDETATADSATPITSSDAPEPVKRKAWAPKAKPDLTPPAGDDPSV